MLLKASQNLLKASASSPSPRFPLSNTVFRLFATCAQETTINLLLLPYLLFPMCHNTLHDSVRFTDTVFV